MCILIILHSNIVIIYNRYIGKWNFTLKTRWRLKIAQRKYNATSSILCKHRVIRVQWSNSYIIYGMFHVRFFICFTLFIYLALSKTINFIFFIIISNPNSLYLLFPMVDLKGFPLIWVTSIRVSRISNLVENVHSCSSTRTLVFTYMLRAVPAGTQYDLQELRGCGLSLVSKEGGPDSPSFSLSLLFTCLLSRSYLFFYLKVPSCSRL